MFIKARTAVIYTFVSDWNTGDGSSRCLTFSVYVTGTRTTSNVTVEVNAIVERSRQENVSHVSQVHETDR